MPFEPPVRAVFAPIAVGEIVDFALVIELVSGALR
jgi:hypothetical protein